MTDECQDAKIPDQLRGQVWHKILEPRINFIKEILTEAETSY